MHKIFFSGTSLPGIVLGVKGTKFCIRETLDKMSKYSPTSMARIPLGP